MQIIAGSKRGAKLAMLADQSVRPTAQRTRESLFNILRAGRLPIDLEEAIVLDLFAGSGALGLEAISRGAQTALFVEKSVEATAIIRQNITKLGFESVCKIIQADCLKTTHWPHQPATLIFCDPPYDKGMAIPALMHMKSIGAIADEALMVIEARKSEAITLPDDMTLLDRRRYGMAALYFCQFTS